MKILNIGPGGFASCCYLVTQDKDAVLIDCSARVDAVTAALQATQATLHAILCTHGHFDHILTADAVRDAFHVPLYLHRQDADLPEDGRKNAHALFFGYDRAWRPAEELFDSNDTLTFGALSLRVMHTPGHSRGSCVFLGDGVAFTGDTLFASGYGRTDLYGGDAAALRHSLQALSDLDGSLCIYPGHGEPTALREALKQLF